MQMGRKWGDVLCLNQDEQDKGMEGWGGVDRDDVSNIHFRNKLKLYMGAIL